MPAITAASAGNPSPTSSGTATAAGVLSERCAAEGRSEDAVRWALWALRRHPYDEAAATRLFELYAAQGDDAAIRREFLAFAGRMREDLQLEPSPRLREMVPAPNAEVMEDDPESDPVNDERNRKLYRMTPLGREVLTAEIARLESVVRDARSLPEFTQWESETA